MANYLNPKKYPKDYQEKLDYIEREIKGYLRFYDKFKGLDFSDVSAGGIQVRLFHKDIEGYSFGNQQTLKYDFSNIEEVINESILDWEENDTEENIKRTKEFIADGEKYGWD